MRHVISPRGPHARELCSTTDDRSILTRAVAYALASGYSGSGSWLDLSGNGHHAQLGSTAGADSNDPLYLTPDSGLPYVYLPGTNDNYVSAPDEAALDIVGDIDIRAKVALADWTPGATSAVISKRANNTTANSWTLEVNTSGTLVLIWRQADTTARTATSSVATGVTDGAVKWVRATLDVDNGSSVYEVKFWLSDDNVTYTQLGTTVTGVATTDIQATTATLEVGTRNAGATDPLTGKVYAFQVYASITGASKVLDVDLTGLASYNAARTTLTAASGQTITVNRASSGRKSVVVERPLFLLGTDDYFEIADHANLDFAETDSFTVCVCARVYGTTANTVYIAKKTDLTTAAGYSLDRGAGGLNPVFTIADGTNDDTDVAPVISAGIFTMVAGRRDVTADAIEGYKNGTGSGSATTDSTTATLANASVLRIGGLSGGGSEIGMEILGWALFREALSALQLAKVATAMGVG